MGYPVCIKMRNIISIFYMKPIIACKPFTVKNASNLFKNFSTYLNEQARSFGGIWYISKTYIQATIELETIKIQNYKTINYKV